MLAALTDPLVGLQLGPAYLGLTMLLPVLVTALVTFVCACMFVIAVGLGVRDNWAYSLVVFVVSAVVFGLTHRGWSMLQPFRRLPTLLPLTSIESRRLDHRRVGSKSKMLARLAATGVRVPQSWALSSRAFEEFWRFNRFATGQTPAEEIAAQVEHGRVPKKLLRRLRRLLESTPFDSFVIRSSFADEDAEDSAYPGVYDSVTWQRSDGLVGLEESLKTVWSSYWSPRAIQYRAEQTDRHQQRLPPLLPVLVCARVDHLSSGFASSADVASGFREHHLIQGAEGNGEPWTWRHSLLTGRVELISGTNGSAASARDLALEASHLAGVAEMLSSVPMEVEWGWDGSEFWAYQARPLTRLDPIATLTNSNIVELPRRPMRALSRWFLFGEEAPAALFNRAFAPLGLPPLGDDAVQIVNGSPWLRVDACKKLLLGAKGGTISPRAAVYLIRAAVWSLSRRRQPLELPAVPPPPSETTAKGMLEELRRLRQRRLVRLVVQEARILQLCALAEEMTARVFPEAEAPQPALIDRLPEAPWYGAEDVAELALPRLIEQGAAEGRDSGRTRQRPDPQPAGTLRQRLAVRLRDGLLFERERLKSRIAATNYEARLLALALSKYLTTQDTSWRRDDVFHLYPTQIASYLNGGIELDDLMAAARRERRNFVEWSRSELPAVLHLNADGSTSTAHAAAEPRDPDTLATGLPLGNGTARGEVLLVRGETPPGRSQTKGRVVVLPDPDMRWEPFVVEAAAVVFTRGGPLSHLALLCRERGLPAVAGVTLSGLVENGTQVEIDGRQGTVRRAH